MSIINKAFYKNLLSKYLHIQVGAKSTDNPDGFIQNQRLSYCAINIKNKEALFCLVLSRYIGIILNDIDFK